MLLSQHALIRGTDILLITYSPCQPVPAPTPFPCCLPGVSEPFADCSSSLHLLVNCLTARLSALLLLVPSLSVCLSLVASKVCSPLWRTPGGVRALLSPEPCPECITRWAACGLSPLLNPTLLPFLKVVIEERFARESFFFFSQII